MELDCSACGACCFNPQSNVERRIEAYVEIDDPRSNLVRDPALKRRFVFHDEDGRPHLRMQGDRCSALEGKLGEHVRCVVYAHRPNPCKNVKAGDSDCLHARRERGLE